MHLLHSNPAEEWPQGEESIGPADSLPLVTDLDGTLIAADTLLEEILSLARHSPGLIPMFAVWLWRGRSVLKAEVARRSLPLAKNLPYREGLVEYLRRQHDAGRRIVLATAANVAVAERVAAYLGVFDSVIASTESLNLKGNIKRDELVSRFGFRGFDYIGDSRADTPVWKACRVGHVAGGMKQLPAAALASGARQGEVFPRQPFNLGLTLREIRLHQWVKNLLVAVPALLNHRVDHEIPRALALAFFGFSFVASSSYIANDLFDLKADRAHPQKRRRPLASGRFPIGAAMTLAVLLLAAGALAGATEGLPLLVCLGVYFLLTLLYSTYIKGKPIIDVVVLASLYTLRVYAGGLVSQAYVSPWLFQFSIFVFLSLAFVKRYSELRGLAHHSGDHTVGRGYRAGDLAIISQAGVASGLLAGLVLALYVNGSEIGKLYPRPEMLWGVCPLFLYWIVRVWLVAHRGNMNEDPVLFAFRDRVSYIVAILIAGAVLLGLTPRV